MPAALVGYCLRGAYTEWVVAMRLEAGEPVLARSRQSNGEVRDLGLAQGASAKHGVDVRLVPEKNAIYDIEWDNDDTHPLAQCTVNAYVWDSNSKTFDWNAELTKQATQSYCLTLQEQLRKQH